MHASMFGRVAVGRYAQTRTTSSSDVNIDNCGLYAKHSDGGNGTRSVVSASVETSSAENRRLGAGF